MRRLTAPRNLWAAIATIEAICAAGLLTGLGVATHDMWIVLIAASAMFCGTSAAMALTFRREHTPRHTGRTIQPTSQTRLHSTAA